MVELKQQELITPDEEKRLEEEIERIRRGAEERVDASSWEAADALREQVVGRPVREAGRREVGRGEPGALRGRGDRPARAASRSAEAQAAELTKALEKLAQSGLLAGAPADLQRLLKGGKLPADAEVARASWRRRSPSISPRRTGRFGGLAQARQGVRPVRSVGVPARVRPVSADGDGEPGRGGDQSRPRRCGRSPGARRSSPFDRFKAQPLPPGAARSPDDWAPVVELPGAPQESPDAERAVGGQAVCGRRRPDRVAPHARAAPPERREEVFREVSHS